MRVSASITGLSNGLHRRQASLISRLYNGRYPLQRSVSRILKNSKIGNLSDRIQSFERPNYAYCVYHAADLARKLGHKSVSVIEFGVAGGNGLILLEKYAREIADELGIEIQVYGFDNGCGLPPPHDYRDLPYHWEEGFFSMDEEALRHRLSSAQLVIGDVAETVETFFEKCRPAPIGAVLHDLDYYSSTVAALRLFNGPEKFRLPRIYCYLDDIIGGEVELYNDFTGVRLAVKEFNEAGSVKISPAYHLVARSHSKPWYHQIFTVHDFKHFEYCKFVSSSNQRLDLNDR